MEAMFNVDELIVNNCSAFGSAVELRVLRLVLVDSAIDRWKRGPFLAFVRTVLVLLFLVVLTLLTRCQAPGITKSQFYERKSVRQKCV